MHIIAEKPDGPLAKPEHLSSRHWHPTVHYLSQTEVHVYALSIAGSVLLSFFPFLIVMLTLIRDVFHMPAAETALTFALRDYFPNDLGAFIIRNLTKVNHGRFQITSVILLLLTANGIFEPLEVALNRAWGVKQNRSYLRNQILSFFMVVLCGGLALGSLLLTASNKHFAATQSTLSFVIFRAAAIPVTMLSLFLVYWILPNRQVPVRRIAPVAVMVGAALEGLKYLFLFAWHWIDIKLFNEYGPFEYAVSIMIFGLAAGMLVLAGAEWSARASHRIPAEDASGGPFVEGASGKGFV